MTKNDFLNRIPWLWIAIILLSTLVILQYFQLLELRKALWYSFGGVASEERVRAIIDARSSSRPATTSDQGGEIATEQVPL